MCTCTRTGKQTRRRSIVPDNLTVSVHWATACCLILIKKILKIVIFNVWSKYDYKKKSEFNHDRVRVSLSPTRMVRIFLLCPSLPKHHVFVYSTCTFTNNPMPLILPLSPWLSRHSLDRCPPNRLNLFALPLFRFPGHVNYSPNSPVPYSHAQLTLSTREFFCFTNIRWLPSRTLRPLPFPVFKSERYKSRFSPTYFNSLSDVRCLSIRSYSRLLKPHLGVSSCTHIISSSVTDENKRESVKSS